MPNLPAYEGTTFGDIPVGLSVGVVVALVAGVKRLAVGIDDPSGKRLSMPVLLLAGGLAVGSLAQVADALGGDSQEVLFSGQAAVPEILAEDSAAIVLLVMVSCDGSEAGCSQLHRAGRAPRRPRDLPITRQHLAATA